jgi:hypothetical protein
MSERKLGFHFQPEADATGVPVQVTVDFDGEQDDLARMGFVIPNAPKQAPMALDADDLEEFGGMCIEFAGRMRRAIEQAEMAEETEE